MQKALDRLKELFLLDEHEVDYIKKTWLYYEALELTAQDPNTPKALIEMGAKLDEQREKFDKQRKEYILDIIATYSKVFCPSCTNLLIFNADIDAIYWCEVCKRGVSYDLKMGKA